MSRITRIFAAALVCASCAHAQETPNPPAPQSGSQARSALTAELFYQLLLSEISLQNNDMGSAYGLMLNAARQAGDPQLFERAVEIALRARDANAALAAARAWQAVPGMVRCTPCACVPAHSMRAPVARWVRLAL